MSQLLVSRNRDRHPSPEWKIFVESDLHWPQWNNEYLVEKVAEAVAVYSPEPTEFVAAVIADFMKSNFPGVVSASVPKAQYAFPVQVKGPSASVNAFVQDVSRRYGNLSMSIVQSDGLSEVSFEYRGDQLPETFEKLAPIHGLQVVRCGNRVLGRDEPD